MNPYCPEPSVKPKRNVGFRYAAGAARDPVAFLKYWTEKDQEKRRLDFDKECEPELAALNPIIVPLFEA